MCIVWYVRVVVVSKISLQNVIHEAISRVKIRVMGWERVFSVSFRVLAASVKGITLVLLIVAFLDREKR